MLHCSVRAVRQQSSARGPSSKCSGGVGAAKGGVDHRPACTGSSVIVNPF